MSDIEVKTRMSDMQYLGRLTNASIILNTIKSGNGLSPNHRHELLPYLLGCSLAENGNDSLSH